MEIVTLRKRPRNSIGQGIIWVPFVIVIASAGFCWKQLFVLSAVGLIIYYSKEKFSIFSGNKLWKLGAVIAFLVFFSALFWSQLIEFFDISDEFSQVLKVVDALET